MERKYPFNICQFCKICCHKFPNEALTDFFFFLNLLLVTFKKLSLSLVYGFQTTVNKETKTDIETNKKIKLKQNIFSKLN